MNDEKRVIDTYEVRHAVKFCGREYILAEDKSTGDDILYMTSIGRSDNPFGIGVHEDIAVSRTERMWNDR